MSQHPSDPAHEPLPEGSSIPDEAGEGEVDPAARSETTESGGPKGPEPTRYGDWERNGRCIDF